MALLTKAQLAVDNGTSFPNNNAGAITPLILREYNTDVIDSTVNQIVYTTDSASWNSQIGAITLTSLNSFTASQNTKNTTLAAYTASVDTKFATLGGLTGSFVTETESGSFLITASVSLNTITFTKGNASTFNITVNTGSGAPQIPLTSLNGFTASQDTKNSTLATYTGSVTISLTNLNTYTASAAISTTNLNSFTASQNTKDSTLGTYTASIDTKFVALGASTASLNSATASLFLSASLALISASVSLNTITFTKGDTSTFNITVNTGSGGGASDLTSLNSFTASQYISNSFFATTGSNTFTGNQTFQDAALNASTLVATSGSLMLVAKSFTSASSHISGTANLVNLIFKNNSNTADTILSGSNNLFVNAAAPTAGFKRYIGGSGNIALNGSNVPQISGSMGFSPTMNNNYFGGNSVGLIMRGPVSSSAWTISGNNINGTVSIGTSAALNAEKLTAGLTMTGNSIAGTLNLIANQSALTGSTTLFANNIIAGVTTLNLSSSAASMQNNIINDNSFTFNNGFYSGSLGVGLVAMNRNNIGGQLNSIIISGSLPAGTTTTNSISDNFLFGGGNTIYIDVQNARVSGSSAYINVIRTGLMGNNLIVSGSSLLGDLSSFGSVFVGRYNADDNIRNKTSDVVLAVGTGNTTTRKTGFLIDSGSNTFVEGTLNVSGSTSLTGSLTATGTFTASLTQGYAWVGNSSNITTLVATSSFGGSTDTGSLMRTGSVSGNVLTFTKGDATTFTLTVATGSGGGTAFPFTGDAQISGSLGVTGSFRGYVNALSVASSTASINMNNGNFFTLNLPTSSTTHINISNLALGQTINLQVSQSLAATGSIVFAPNIRFAGGFDYTVTPITGAMDILSFVSFDTNQIFATSVKNLL